jgi:hypothetical protein
MLGGLLHDLGEMYIDPRHGEADAERSLDFLSYQQLVVHPHVGKLLLSQLTNYPPPLARAIGEHHERLDGSGYPHALQRETLSPLGRLLAVTEATLAVMRGEQPCLARASVALRVVPGEFDLAWVGRIADAARHEPLLQGGYAPETLKLRLARLDGGMLAAQACATALVGSAESAALTGALALAEHLLGRLRTGWTASGLWCDEAVAGQDVAEVDAIEHELSFRLRAIERAARLRAGDLPEADARRLALLCDSAALGGAVARQAPRGSDADLVAPAPLGGIERTVAGLQQVELAGHLGPELGHAHRYRLPVLDRLAARLVQRVGQFDRKLRHRLPDALGQVQRTGHAGIRQHEGEFVARRRRVPWQTAGAACRAGICG